MFNHIGAHMNTLAFSVTEFCSSHSISRAKFYLLMKEGLAPSNFLVGNRRLISIESAKKWREDMQNRAQLQVMSGVKT